MGETRNPTGPPQVSTLRVGQLSGSSTHHSRMASWSTLRVTDSSQETSYCESTSSGQNLSLNCAPLGSLYPTRKGPNEVKDKGKNSGKRKPSKIL